MTDAPKIEQRAWAIQFIDGDIHAVAGPNAAELAQQIFAMERDDVSGKMIRVTIIDTASLEAERERLAELEGLLREAQPLVAEREFLEKKEFAYGSGYPEPSPAEWGIQIGYVQTVDQMPVEQFSEEVDEYHTQNRDEDEDGEYLSLANKIADALSKESE